MARWWAWRGAPAGGRRKSCSGSSHSEGPRLADSATQRPSSPGQIRFHVLARSGTRLLVSPEDRFRLTSELGAQVVVIECVSATGSPRWPSLSGRRWNRAFF
jgi:hypothetical protein